MLNSIKKVLKRIDKITLAKILSILISALYLYVVINETFINSDRSISEKIHFILFFIFFVYFAIIILSVIIFFAFQGKYKLSSILYTIPILLFLGIIITVSFIIFPKNKQTIEEYRSEDWHTLENRPIEIADSLALSYFKSSSLLYPNSTFYFQKTIEDSIFYTSYFFFQEKSSIKKAPLEFLKLFINKDFTVTAFVEKKALREDKFAALLLSNYFKQQKALNKLKESIDKPSEISNSEIPDSVIQIINDFLKIKKLDSARYTKSRTPNY